jgi:hypothetical protein
MDALVDSGVSTKELGLLNQCRMFLQATNTSLTMSLPMENISNNQPGKDKGEAPILLVSI